MQKRHLLTLFAAASMAVSATAAYADAPRYDFVDLSYQSINDPSSEGLSSDHGYGFDASYAVTTNWLVSANYGHENADFSFASVNGPANGTVSGDSYELGIGYRFPLSDSVDLVPNLSYGSGHATASATGFISNSQTNSGYDAGVELRAMVTSAVELDANVDHLTPGSATNQIGVGALYNFTHSFAVGLGYDVATSDGQNTTGWTLALRYYFK